MQNKKLYGALIIFNKVNLENFDSLYQKTLKAHSSSFRGNSAHK